MEIRNATTQDANEIREIFRNTIQKVNCKDYSPKQVKAWSNFADLINWNQFLIDQEFWVVEINNVIAGYISLDKNGYLDHLYVHHQYQGVGVASQLIKALESEAKKRGESKTWASVSITAQPFFKSKGYKEVRKEIREANGESFENAIMEKELF